MKLVVLDGKTVNPGDNPWTPLESFGALEIYDRTAEDQIVSRCADAAIVLTNKVPFTEATLEQLPNLKFIAVTATGYNVVDTVAASKYGVVVSNVPEYSTLSVAQHVFAMLLSYLHRPAEHHQAIVAGQWQASGDFSFTLAPIHELAGKTMGIVGLGRTGRATAAIAAAFGMRVVASSRRQINPLPAEGFEWLSVEQLFEQADVISIHCPQTDQTKGFIDTKLLSRMKSSSILINTARGGLVDERALADTLNAGGIAGALLDVCSTEPIGTDNPLLGAKNCVITPHIAWATVAARLRLMQTTADNVAAFLKGQPQNVVS